MKIYKKLQKSQQNQRGFAMLEVVLAVVIIAIASFGIYKLYNSSSITSKMNDTENLVSQIQSAVNQMSYTLSAQPSALQLYNSGSLPISLWKSAPGASGSGTLNSAFGPNTVTYNSLGSYAYIDVSRVPSSIVAEFCSHMSAIGDIYYGASNPATTLYSATDVSTQKFTASSDYHVTIYFPRGKKK